MARTALTPIDCPLQWATTPATLTWTAADNVNGNEFTWTGKEILLVRNDDVGAQLVTIDSVPDPYTREGDQTQSVPAGAYRIFGSPFPSTGWLQADGKIYVDAASANVMLAVITIQD